MKKYENVRPEYKIWFSTPEGEGILGDGKWKILMKIDECGSLVKACEEMGITYRRTWNDLKKVEKLLGFDLLETSRGGQEGGSTRLTAEGHKLVVAFRRFHEKMDRLMAEEFRSLLEELIKE
ncbi:MAG TPA: LysR family transcriptional regulator [Bacteroidales bacterium]|nr:LysR family transcriptional regulator [Bacteroidales bacterium]HPT03190.1 LysR family transcriptional regulator [Bacteroidales bacterium]